MSSRLIEAKQIGLPNGYAIALKREKISREGRSIFRSFDFEQIVMEIVDQDGRTTKRLPIPASVRDEVAEFLSQ
ncbi:hypothetical protein M4D58_23840 [Brevibacillus borstelensis]|uniref:hypothetical protein n=1 Tax=Brevibacillus borstelensis TaxID=45462 RepID=UPI0020410C70|nr:hypothetical protein [Brevibacillus borstelensis]MCM3593658.1 hypothetical protein [Brevibacillus borstelensis]